MQSDNNRCPFNETPAAKNRLRKLFGGLIMIAFVCIYGLVAMALAQARFVQDASPLMQTLLYAVLGLSWIFPMMPLIAWMERPQSPKN